MSKKKKDRKATIREQWEWAHNTPYGRIAQVERLEEWLKDQTQIKAYRAQKKQEMLDRAFGHLDSIPPISAGLQSSMPILPGNTSARKVSTTSGTTG